MSKNKHKSTKHQKARNKHHVIPSSRVGKAGKIHPEGWCKVDADIHTLSHCLHGNRTPEEIVQWYNEYLWGNSYDITITKKGA